jgi:hypothetical protein
MAAPSRRRIRPDTSRNQAIPLARGEEIVSNTGQPVKLSRPLDWLGVVNEVLAGNPKLMADPTRWNQEMHAGESGR